MYKISSLIFFMVVFINNSSYSQTVRSFINTGTTKPKILNKNVSANNFWMGAQVGYKFGGTKEFSDNLLVSGRLLYDIDLDTKKFGLPVMGNISTLRDAFANEKTRNKDTLEARSQELLLSSQGINVGLYPYYDLVKKEKFLLTAHSALAWKLNSFKTKSDQNEYLNQGRFSLGIEASVGGRTSGRYPLVLSIAPVVTVFDKAAYEKIFAEKKGSINSLEITAVVPLGNGLGLLLENVSSNQSTSAFRVGIIIAGQAGKKQSNNPPANP